MNDPRAPGTPLGDEAPAAGAVRLPRLFPTSGREDLAAHVARLGAVSPAAGLIKAVELAGLVGRGGAAFPTAEKLRAAAGASPQRPRSARGRREGGTGALVVVNAMEGEPASAKDRVLLGLAPHLVLDGAVLVAAAIGATEVVVCVPRTPHTVRWAADRDIDTGSDPGLAADAGLTADAGPTADPGRTAGFEHGDLGRDREVEVAARSVQRAIGERDRSDWDAVPISLARPPDHYISGEGTALARWLGGGPALPAFTRVRLAECGVGGAPTLIDNAETLAHVALIARFGAAWFRSLGTEADPGTTLVTVSGAVARPGVAEVPLGTTIGELLRAAGGPSEPVQAVLLGGYGGVWVPIDTALGLPVAHRRPGTPSIGPGIVVALPSAACGLVETARVARYLAGEGAGQCGPCVYGLPALAGALDALAWPVSPAAASAAVDQIARWGAQIVGRGACHHPDGVVRLVRGAISAFADDVLFHAAGVPCAHTGRPSVLPIPGRSRARDGSRQ